MKFAKYTIAALATLAFLGGCTSKSQLEKTLKDNPDILFGVIKAHPKEFLQTVNEAVRTAQQGAAEEQEKADQARMEDEFKNPKTPVIDEKRPVFGNVKAPITIVEYSDFECPFCARAYGVVKQVQKKYGDKVRIFYKDLPLDIHPMAMPAARYYEAIALQDHSKAKKFHDLMFENQDQMRAKKDKFLKEMAKKVGANMKQLAKDIDSDKVKKTIQTDMEEAKKFDFSGTPGFLINGVSIRGAYPLSEFEKVIDRELKDLKK